MVMSLRHLRQLERHGVGCAPLLLLGGKHQKCLIFIRAELLYNKVCKKNSMLIDLILKKQDAEI
jgi:hypothetical protein